LSVHRDLRDVVSPFGGKSSPLDVVFPGFSVRWTLSHVLFPPRFDLALAFMKVLNVTGFEWGEVF